MTTDKDNLKDDFGIFWTETTMSTQDELREQIKAAIEQDDRMNELKTTIDSKAVAESPKVKKTVSSSSKKPKGAKRYKRMSAKDRKTHQRVGTKNLLDWQKKNPAGGRLTHGAESKTIRQRYSDLRTKEGRQLKEIIDGLVSDLGGPNELQTGHNILLSNIRAKLICVMQISKFSDRAKSLINPAGEIIPVLGRNFLSYTESLRRDIECLFGIKRGKAQQSYEKALNALKGDKA